MASRVLFLWFPAVVLCTCARADAPAFDPATMMRVEEVQRGMKGYGLSVFHGVQIERFDVEIMGVLSQAILGADMILAKVTSGPVVERNSGIIGGMSGSPVYINDRLIGAIAYGWGFTREPICGITPIEAMLDSLPGGQEQTLLPRDHPLRGALVEGRWVTQARVQPAHLASARFADRHTLNMQPVGPLVYASGLKGVGMQKLAETLAPYGIEPLAGPGRMRDPVPVELQPGAAVGVTLATGSFDITGIGTLTWRQGDKVLAFGHPMMGLGLVDMPMTTAWVHDFVPSIARSNKLASAMAPVGSVLLDGNWAIGGTVGREAPTVPARVVVTNLDRDLTREFHFEVARQELMTGPLLISVLGGALEATFNAGTRGVGTLEFTVRGEKGVTMHRRDVIWHPGSVVPVMSWVNDVINILNSNRYQPQQVASLEARVTLTGVDRSAAVERIYTEETVARAGKPLNIHVVLRPEGGKPIEKVVTLQMPENLPKGQIRLGAAAGAEEWSLKSRLRLLMPQINSLEDIARVVEQMRRSDQLYVAVALPEVTLAVQGTELPYLPTELAQSLADAARTDMDAGYTELSRTLDTELVLYGWQGMRLPTEDRQGQRGKVEGSRPGEDGAELSTAASKSHGLERLWWAADALDREPRTTAANEVNLELPDREEGNEEKATTEEQPSESTEEKEKEKEKKRDSAEHPETDEENLTRQLSTWTQDSADDFASGEAHGILVRSDGTLLLAPAAQVLASAAEPYILTVTAAGEKVYYGTANPGRVYCWTAAQGARLLCDTGQFMVTSLLALPDGSVLAGTGPGGKVLRISADGTSAPACELPALYVWSLVARADGTVVAGTGPGGRIYTVGPSPAVVATIGQPHVLSLLEADGVLYAAGGAEEGGVYRISPEGTAQDLVGTDEKSCTGIASDGHGGIYVSTASDGKLLFLSPSGSVVEVLDSDEDLLGVCFADGRAWAASADDGKILAADDQLRHAVAYQDDVATRVVAIAAGEGAVYAATANPARLIRLDLRGPASGSFDSAVLDAERVSRWARLFYDAVVPEGATLSLLTRSGNSQVPEDGSWGAWTGPYEASGADLVNAPARFLQYRVSMSAPSPNHVELRRLTILYLPANQRPSLEVDSPKPGEALRSEYEISWDADDDDDDILRVTIYLRPQGGEWQKLAEVQDEDSYKWDTTQHPDGMYSLKLVCTDLPSNPLGAQSAEVVIDTIIVDQGYPKLTVFQTPRRGEDGRAVLRALAVDALSRITSIDWRLGEEGQWQAAAPDDGLLSSNRELFTVRLEGLTEQDQVLQVRLRDAAGNVTIETLPLDGAAQN